jgi:hypothetical protein
MHEAVKWGGKTGRDGRASFFPGRVSVREHPLAHRKNTFFRERRRNWRKISCSSESGSEILERKRATSGQRLEFFWFLFFFFYFGSDRSRMSSHTPVACRLLKNRDREANTAVSIALSSDKRSERNKKKRPKIQSDNVVSRSNGASDDWHCFWHNYCFRI